MTKDHHRMASCRDRRVSLGRRRRVRHQGVEGPFVHRDDDVTDADREGPGLGGR